MQILLVPYANLRQMDRQAVLSFLLGTLQATTKPQAGERDKEIIPVSLSENGSTPR